jgi:endonuclease YncB( thermonuclease family)
MGQIIRPQFGRGRGMPWFSLAAAAFAVGIVLLVAGWPLVSPYLAASTPTVTRLQTTAPQIPQKIFVVDGDTVRMGGTPYRLVGFNTPENGRSARCAAEEALSAKATARLKQLLASGEPILQRVPCACKPGTEGTDRCNYGRLCAVLTVAGVDVAPTMIGEGLAERYVCGSTNCPRRRNWCG